MQLIAQPLDGRARHENRTLQRIIHLAVQSPRHGGDQPVVREHRLFTDIHQHKAAGAEGAFCLAPLEAGLPKQRRLLVTRRTGNLDLAAEVHRVGVLVKLAVGHGVGQHTARYVKDLQDLIVPVQRVDVEQHRPAGVGIVGHMDLAAGQLPDQPCLDRAKEQVAPLGPRAHAGHIVQNPFQLGCREIGVNDKAGLFPDLVGQALRLERIAVFACAAALPYDGMADRLAGVAVPDDRCLALVCNANGGNILRRGADLVHGRQRHAQLGGPDLVGIMLHPARLGEVLGKLLLRHAAHLASGVEKDAPVGGRACIQRHNVLFVCHRNSPCGSENRFCCLYYTGCLKINRVANVPKFCTVF